SIELGAGQPVEEVELPPGARIFAVRCELQADLFLLADDFPDFRMFDVLQLRGRNLSLLALRARLLEWRGAQDAADMIGAERRYFSLHFDESLIGSCSLTPSP